MTSVSMARARALACGLLAALAFLASALPCVAQMQFTDVTATPGSELDSPVDVQGVAWGDADNDGDDDIYLTLVLSAVIGSGKRLYRNDGGDIFHEVAAVSGVSDDQTGFGAAWGDFDNDTDSDLLLANGAVSLLPNALRLYENSGYGTFVDMAPSRGLTQPGSGRSVVWADYDNDGDLDFFLCTPSLEGEYLFRNDGGTFVNVTSAAGITSERNSNGAAWADYDRDGDVDLYVVDHGIQPFITERNRLYRNNGDGTFTEVGAAAGVDDAGSGNGAAWGDCDNDGDLDLYLANGLDIASLFGIDAPNRLYRNNGDGTFTDIAAASGVEDRDQVSFSAAWGDFDNDGQIDLYVTNSKLATNSPANAMYRNLGNCTFTEMAQAAGVEHSGAGQGTALADYDNDGDLDIFVASLFGQGGVTARLYRNDSPPRHWLILHLIGTDSNRDGMGAYVEVHAGATTFTRQANGGSGYLSQDSLDVEFGLGSLASVDDVTIHWPSGCVQVIPNPTLDQYHKVLEDCMPGFDAASVADDPCAPSLTVSWEPATWASGVGHYEVRRGADCPDAGRQPELLPRPAGTSFVDATTLAGGSYVYVIRAFDDVNGIMAEQCTSGTDLDGSVFSITASAPSPVCPGATVDYTSTGPVGATFRWDFDVATDSDGNTVPDDDADAATADASHLQPAGGTFVARVTVISVEGCAKTQDVTVEVIPDPGPTIDPASLRVTRVGPEDPLLAWAITAGSGDTDVHRTLDDSQYAIIPLPVPVVATVPGTTHLDSVTLTPGQCAYYQVFGRPCSP